jgi:serine/threonine-protein kinase
VADADPLIGRVIAGKFRVDRALGAGAMGKVYLAEQTNLGKMVAIKVLHANMAGDSALEKRFHREAKSASVLSHPNIVQMIDFGQEEGLLYIAMELLNGRDLGKVVRKDWPFAPERLGNIIGQVLSALEEAHDKGIVHRDLKPENIVLLDVRGEDFVKVCDFGIAKISSERDGEGSAITMAGMVCGTPEYMSPEQARGDPLDGRSDLWSVAVMLYYMTSGELPFRGETALGVVTKLLTDAPIPPSKKRPGVQVGGALEAMILRGLEKDRAKRHANATAMKEALFDAVGLKRPSSGQQRARAPGESEPELALADTGVATPASQPAFAPTQAQGISVHGEMSASAQPARKRNWLVIGSALALVAGVAVVGGRALMKTPAAVVSAAAPPIEPAKVDPPKVEVINAAVEPPKVEPPKAQVINAAVEPPKAEPPKKEHHKKVVAAKAEAKVEAKPEAKPVVESKHSTFVEAEEAFKHGNVEGALAKYLEVARQDPRDAWTQRQIGKCYNRLGQRDKAQPYLKRYLELEPNASDAAFIRAMIQ